MTTIHEVYETVRDARAEGPDALAAMALSFGATMVLGVVRCRALRGQIAEMRAALEATEATVATLRAERDAALAEAKAAQESAQGVVEAWRLRESVAALRDERDRAVQEREAFSLRLSAAERERDEARAALDLARESAREAREEIAQSLALVDEARAALDAALARPTYEARTVAPTGAECDVHQKAGGRWLRAWHRPSTGTYCVSITHLHRTESVEHLDGATWLPLGADGLPCVWPVPSAEVTP